MIKTRKFPEHNYFSVWDNGKTVRFQIEDDKPITELKFPEFYDMKITGKCSGNCPWCYMDSKCDEEHYEDIYGKAERFFGPMTPNERPFQVAIGGGNPNEHPDFVALLYLLASMGITPNYTTNGIGLTDRVIRATEQVCGGVAISFHPHLWDIWSKAVEDLWSGGITKLNAHIIISDQCSIDLFYDCYLNWKDKIDKFVLLPYEAMGRAEPKEIDYGYLAATLNLVDRIESVAFGAGFYEWLKSQNFPVSLYEPELMSKFLDMKDMKLYKSSFHLEEVPLPERN